MAERVHRLRVAGRDEALARGGVDLPAGDAGPRVPRRLRPPTPRARPTLRRTSSGALGLAVVEEVPDALQVARVLLARDAEVDVQQLARASSASSPGGAWPTSFSGPALTAGQWSRPHA